MLQQSQKEYVLLNTFKDDLICVIKCERADNISDRFNSKGSFFISAGITDVRCIVSSNKIYSGFTTEGNFCVQFDKPLCAMRHTGGKMFPRIAKCIIYHASHHLFRTFKMLLQYLELQIIHVSVIRRVKIQQMGGSTINI